MRLFVSFTILFFCTIQGFGQKITPVKKIISQKKITIANPNGFSSHVLFGKYTILKYYNLIKKSPKKKEVSEFMNSEIEIKKESITGVKIHDIAFTIYEIETMKKDDYLYRVFNQIVSTYIIELPEEFKVHKTDLTIFFGIIQLPNGNIAFPYKGGLIIANPYSNK